MSPTSPSTGAGRDRGADLVDVRGAVVAPGDQVAIIATGSEVEVAVAARQLLADEGISARVVSLPSFELFFERPQGEREDILPTRIPRAAVEAANPFGWSALTPDVGAMTTFGKSARGPDLYGSSASPPRQSPSASERCRAGEGKEQRSE